ncbi:substrate-binding domain-containing protein [Winogradskyella aurantiaca]|uniref:substrate-binding domain-containing protein n=1 Tax=Winogradskyella aurantiaca TaxID=2219558 RepID=UPI000E1DD897|nr:substrate-binding domain-containing protein [Winogradskyella aurantiaca]
MLTVKVGGVPEHFNYPWYLALKDGAFKKQNINLRWVDCHGGTGEMCGALRNNEIDIAIILTEGIVSDIIKGNPSSIVQTYVSSPLIWGIHVSNNSQYEDISDLRGKIAAISRMGSGSHLMAYVNAQNHGWDLENDMNFYIVNNLEGGVKALINGEADYFLWEHFTTKPFVDRNVLKKISDCPTPWPCFVIAVRQTFLDENRMALERILEIINFYTFGIKKIPNLANIISERYGQKFEDVMEWLKLTNWDQSAPSEFVINRVQNRLRGLGVINNIFGYNQLVQKL